MEKTYNGWTNYATWRVNLELFDGMDVDDLGVDAEEWMEMDNYDRKTCLAELVDAWMADVPNIPDWITGYARAFLSEVNWYEIASHFTELAEQSIVEKNDYEDAEN